MKHIVTSVITTFLAITSCTAMKIQKNNATKIKEITCIPYAQHAQYLRRDRIILKSPKGCHIIDPITDKEIIRICDICPAHIAVHPDKTKVALSRDLTITVYSYNHDTDKVEKIWSMDQFPLQNSLYSSIFSPFDETIITRHAKNFGFLKHNYTTNKTMSWNNPTNAVHPPKIAFHPIQPKICLAHSSGDISIHEYNELNLLNAFKIKNYHYFCAYNSNGSIIACGNKTSLYIVYPHIKKRYRIPKQDEKDWWDCIAFHPNGSVLTTLSSPNSILQHWDIETRQVIEEISPLDKHPLNNQNICFLSDGTELMITSNKCIIMPISFNVIYPPSTQKKLRYLLFFLKNYTPDSESALPTDVITLLILNMLAVFRY